MGEPIGNIAMVHKECSDARHEAWQENNKDTIIKPGGHVKKAFAQGNDTEHMWVFIKRTEGNKIFGVLDNDPFVVTNIKCGDEVIMDRNEVEDYII